MDGQIVRPNRKKRKTAVALLKWGFHPISRYILDALDAETLCSPVVAFSRGFMVLRVQRVQNRLPEEDITLTTWSWHVDILLLLQDIQKRQICLCRAIGPTVKAA